MVATGAKDTGHRTQHTEHHTLNITSHYQIDKKQAEPMCEDGQKTTIKNCPWQTATCKQGTLPPGKPGRVRVQLVWKLVRTRVQVGCGGHAEHPAPCLDTEVNGSTAAGDPMHAVVGNKG